MRPPEVGAGSKPGDCTMPDTEIDALANLVAEAKDFIAAYGLYCETDIDLPDPGDLEDAIQRAEDILHEEED